MIDDRLALAALRGVVQELEGDPAGAAEVLRRVLGSGPALSWSRSSSPAIAPEPKASQPTSPVVDRGPPVVDRDTKPAKASRPKPPGVPLVDGAEAAELARRLIERHGGVAQAARALPTSPAALRRWRKGLPVQAETVERLRAALEREDQVEREERGNNLAAAIDDLPEAQQLVRKLSEKHGGLEAAAEALGYDFARLRELAAGGPCSAGQLKRLREAVEAPVGQRARFRYAPREEGAGDEPAGEGA